jgi:hypothetical protein
MVEKICLAALVQVLVVVNQLDGHALRIGLAPGAQQLFGGLLGGIEFFVLNEAFQHGALLRSLVLSTVARHGSSEYTVTHVLVNCGAQALLIKCF